MKARRRVLDSSQRGLLALRSVGIEGIRGRIFKAFSAHLFGYVVRLANRLLLPPLFIQAWGQSAYGDWLSLTSLLFFFSLSDLGARYYLNNHLTLAVLEQRAAELTRSLSSAIGVALLVAVVGAGLCANFTSSANFALFAVLLLAAQFLCTSLEQILLSAFRALGIAHHGMVLVNAAEIIQVGVTGVLLYWQTPPGTLFALSYLLPHLMAVGVAFGMIRLRLHSTWDWRIRWRHLQQMYRQSSPFFSTLLSEALAVQGLITVFAWLNSATDVAAWGTLRTMANLALVVPVSLALATWPELIRLKGSRSQQSADDLFRIQVRSSLFLTALLILVLMAVAPMIYHYWLRGKIAFNGTLFGLMLAFTFVNGFWTTFQKYLLVTEPLLNVGRATLLAAAITVLISVLCGKVWGPTGFTVGAVIGELGFPVWYFPRRVQLRVGAVRREFGIAAILFGAVIASQLFPILLFLLIPILASFVVAEHSRLRRFTTAMAKPILIVIALGFLLPDSLQAQDMFKVVVPAKSGETTCLNIQKALKSSETAVVALAAGKDFRLDCGIEIPDGSSLWIPASTTLTFLGKGTAITVPGNGQLMGNGTVRTHFKAGSIPSLSPATPRTAILVKGSEASIQLGKIEGFEYGVYLLGENQGCAYNEIRIRKILNTLQAIKLNASGSGWVNQNYVHISRVANSMRGKDPNWADTYGIYIDSESEHAPNANRFSGSIENTRFGVRLVGLYNRLDGLRIELEDLVDMLSVRIVIAQSGFAESHCGNKAKGKGCIPTKDNWWFGEWGQLRKRDVLFTEGFTRFPGASAATALQAFGVNGWKELTQ